MKIHHFDGRIFTATYDSDLFRLHLKSSNVMEVLEIDEVAGNAEVCKDLVRTLHKMNIDGLQKYYVEAGELHVRDGWEEYVQS